MEIEEVVVSDLGGELVRGEWLGSEVLVLEDCLNFYWFFGTFIVRLLDVDFLSCGGERLNCGRCVYVCGVYSVL